MSRGLTVGQPSKIDTLKTKKKFFFSSMNISLKQISGTPFSVSGQRCGQPHFQKKKKPCKLSIYKAFCGRSDTIWSRRRTRLGRRREKTAI